MNCLVLGEILPWGSQHNPFGPDDEQNAGAKGYGLYTTELDQTAMNVYHLFVFSIVSIYITRLEKVQGMVDKYYGYMSKIFYLPYRSDKYYNYDDIFMPPNRKIGGILFYRCPSICPSVCLSSQT